MLETNLISFKGGLIQILEEALDSADSSYEEAKQILLNIIIPFFNGAESDQVKKLLILEAKQSGITKVKDTAQIFIDRISTDGLSSDRFDWIQGVIRGLNEIGIPSDSIDIDPKIMETGSEQNSSQLDRNLYLKDGSGLLTEEVLLIVSTISDLQNLLEKEDKTKTTYFDWTTIVEHLVPQLATENQLEEMVNLIRDRLSKEISRETYLGRLHIAISQRYVEFNNLPLAWDYARKALDATNPSGWVSYWDGGIRYKALNQLKAIDAEKTRAFIFDLYATDISERSYYPENLVNYLTEILNVLDSEIAIPDIWAEIEYYLDDLFISVDLIEVTELERAFDAPDDLIEKDSPRLAMVEMLILFLAYPSYPIAQRAVRGLANLLINAQKTVVDALNSVLLSSNDLLIERLLMVLDSLSLNDDSLTQLEVFVENLHELCHSPNFAIRLIACKVFSRIKASPPMVSFKNTELPSIYQLQLPESSQHETWKVLMDGHAPPLIGDLARKIKPLDEEFRIIAKIANLPVDNIFFRAVSFFETFLKEKIWIDDGEPLSEKRLLAFLENTGVSTSHSKPHIFAARQALAYVIAELWDCGYLSMGNIGSFELLLMNYDPGLIIQKPLRRPEYICQIRSQTAKKSHDRFSKDWVGNAKESIQLLSITTDDNQIILGESTKIKFLQDEWPTEIRYSVVKDKAPNQFWNEVDIDQGFSPFIKEIDMLIQDYPEIQAPIDQIIVSNKALRFETPGSDWLALNPILGYELGWKLESAGVFQWVDDSDNIVARSLWWRDGSIELYNRFERIEVAEGWSVLVSKAGFEEIKQITSILHRGVVINRRIGWLGDKGSWTEKEISDFSI